jgi:tRNA pseudouridine38-40 synthase
MPRYRALLEYDGTDFLGFQRQAAGRTVQGEVEAALGRIGWTGRTIWGAGRTDAGVHASGQVIAFEMEWGHGEAALERALNANLPPDAAVREVAACDERFHPRYSARARRYRYTFFSRPVRSPLTARYAWHVWPPLDLAAVEAASAGLLGTHDFASFGTDPDGGTNTVRTVSQAAWQAAPGGWLTFDIVAEAFLQRMVRSLAGALRQVGSGALSPDDLAGLLAAREREQCPPAAPPQGLCLVEVLY